MISFYVGSFCLLIFVWFLFHGHDLPFLLFTPVLFCPLGFLFSPIPYHRMHWVEDLMPLRPLLVRFPSSTYGITSWRQQKSWAWPTALITCKATLSSGMKNWWRSMEGQPSWAMGSVRRGWRHEAALTPPKERSTKVHCLAQRKEMARGPFLPYRNILKSEWVWGELCVNVCVRVQGTWKPSELKTKLWHCVFCFFHCSSKTFSDSYHEWQGPSPRRPND